MDHQLKMTVKKDAAASELDVSRWFLLFVKRMLKNTFCNFERVAVSSKWPADILSLLLQCIISGKAQEAYAALTI